MGAANYVNRVGSLALALGVGAAVATGQGVAAADPGDSAPSSDAGAASSDTAANDTTSDTTASDTTQTEADPEAAEADPEDDDPDGDDPEEAEPEPDDEVEPEDETTPEPDPEIDPDTADDSAGSDAPEPAPAPQYDPPAQPDPAPQPIARDESHAASEIIAQTVSDTTEVATATTLVVADAPQAAPISFRTAAIQAVAPPVAPSPLAVIATFPIRLVTGVLSALGLGPVAGPGIPRPTDTPLAWAVLAWVRRQFSYSFLNDSPGATAVPSQDPGQSELGVVTGNLNVDDDDDEHLSYTVVGVPSRGQVTINADGTYTYTPGSALAQSGGTDTFRVEVSDAGDPHIHGLWGLLTGRGHTYTAEVTVTVAAVNAAPQGTVEFDDEIDEDGTVTGVVIGTDVDSDPADLRYTITSNPSVGAATIDEVTGEFSYTPTPQLRHSAAANPALTDTFTVTITDGEGGSTQVVVNPTIDPTNGAPTTNQFLMGFNQVTGEQTGGWGYSDPDGDTLTFTGSRTTDKGTVVVTYNNWYFKPTQEARDAAFAATDSSDPALRDTFTVTITDGHGAVIVHNITVQIVPTNYPPTASVDYAAAGPDPATGAVSGVIVAEDPNGDHLGYELTSPPTRGELEFNQYTGEFTYTPDPDLRHDVAADPTLTDPFTVEITDYHGGVIELVVTPTIVPDNTAPDVTVDVDAPASDGTASGTVGTTDDDGDDVTFTVVQPPSLDAEFEFLDDGTFVYTPTAGTRHDAALDGSDPVFDSFIVRVDDGHGGVILRTIDLKVLPANEDPEFAEPEAPDVDSDGVVTGHTGITDGDADTLTYTVTGPTNKGGVTVVDGVFTFTPTADARHAAAADNAPLSDRTATFELTADDGHGGSITRTYTVDILSANEDPNIIFGYIESTDQVNGTIRIVLDAVDDDEDDDLVYEVTRDPSWGSVVFDGSTVVYQPTRESQHDAAQGVLDTDTFTVTVYDGHGGSDEVTLTVTIVPRTNQYPRAGDPGTPELDDETGSLTGSLGFIDPDGDPLTYYAYSLPAYGNLELRQDGTYVYTPTPRARHDAAGGGPAEDFFVVSAYDPYFGTANTYITVAIDPANEDPTITVSAPTSTSTGPITIAVTVADEDRDRLTVTADQPQYGDLTQNIDGSWTYVRKTTTPAAVTSDTVTFRVTDGHGGSASQTVTVLTSPAVTQQIVITHVSTNPTTGAATYQVNAGIPGLLQSVQVGSAVNGFVSSSTNLLGVTTVVFTPDPTYRHNLSLNGSTAPGTGSFTVTSTGLLGAVTSHTETVSIAPYNRAPSINVVKGPPTSSGTNITVATTDPDNDAVAVSWDTPSHGVISRRGANYVYTSDPEYSGQVTLKFYANDGHGGVVSDTIDVTSTGLELDPDLPPLPPIILPPRNPGGEVQM